MTTPKKKRGRPSTGPRRESPITVRVTPEERAELAAAAERAHPGIAVSTWARGVLLRRARESGREG